MLFRSTTTKFLLALTLIPFAPGCEEDDGGDDSGDTGSNDDGPGDDGGGDGGPGDGGDEGGSADGGPGDGADPGDGGPADSGDPGDGGGDGGGSDIGDTCTDNSECSDVCVFAGDADFGICTARCESFADCPDFWDCGPVGNASGDYCIPG